MHVYAGDVGFTQGTGPISGAIRYATTGPREERTWANHTLVFTKAGLLDWNANPAWKAHAVEALWRVEENPWIDRHRTEAGYKLRVYRPLFLSPEETARVVGHARAHVGDKYGWWKLGAHLLDRIAFGDEKKVSNLLRDDDRPICSYLVARAFDVGGHRYAFGDVEPTAQDPDEMMDYCRDSLAWKDNLRMCSWKFVGEYTVPELEAA